jgi:ATP-binding cassette subfamily F protein 3
MSLLSLLDADFDFGRETILSHVHLNLLPGVKYALVGANGAGKTTLLSVLAGELPLNGGTRQVSAGVRVRWLRQDMVLAAQGEDERPLRECVEQEAFGAELALEVDLARLSRQLAAGDEGVERERLTRELGRLQTEFEHREGYTRHARLEAALSGVGLAPSCWERRLSALSGGERRRAALAAILLAGADLLLLDEPTNHLDLAGCEWLESFLQSHAGTAVLVSHDRQFLDRLAQQTLEIERGRLTAYSGNYSFYERARRQQRQQQEVAWQRQQEHIARAADYIRRNIAGQKTRQAQSRRKQLAKVKRLERPSTQPAGFRLAFRPARSSGSVVLQVEGLRKSYGGHLLFADLDLLVTRGQRIGVVGPNGCGKTTLLRVLCGQESPDAGVVSLGHNVDLGVYDQQILGVSDHHRVIEELAEVDPRATIGELRSRLGAFGFGEELYDRSVARLSGGERGRLALLRLMLEGYNTLLLDEPTNHLDVRCRESLEEGLAAYDGTLIVVSHDRRFLDRVVERLLVFTAEEAEGRVDLFPGNYTEFRLCRLEQQEARAETAEAARAGVSGSGQDRVSRSREDDEAAARRVGPLPLSKNEQARRRRWIAEVEEEISALETERTRLLEAMAAPDLPAPERLEAGTRCVEIDRALAERMELWEQWHREMEGTLQDD